MRLSHTKLGTAETMIMTTINFPPEELSTHSWPVTMLSFSCWAPQITRGKCYRVKSCVWAQQSTSLVQRIYSVYLSKMDKNKPRNPPPAAGMLNEYTYFCPVGIKIEPCLDLVCRRAVRISDFHWTIIINISFFKYYRYQYRYITTAQVCGMALEQYEHQHKQQHFGEVKLCPSSFWQKITFCSPHKTGVTNQLFTSQE